MRIGLNLLFMIPDVVGGTETYARGLLEGFRRLRPNHEFVIFLNRESSGWVPDDGAGFKVVVCPVNAVSRSRRYAYEHLLLRREVRRHGIDLLHSLGYTSPVFLACPTVVSVHDLNFRAFGSLMPLPRRLMLSLAVKQAVVHSDKVITISEFSRQEILRTYNVAAEKVVVTYLAADFQPPEPESHDATETFAGMEWMREPYIVAFSHTYPNKNLPRLLEAFSEAKRLRKFAQRLVLIGHPYLSEDWTPFTRDLVERRDVIWAGYLERRHMFSVLRRADFLVFPSFYEGFGLPVLEAMAVGVPVVCSRAASLPEVAGTAAVYFDPFSVADIAEKIVSVATNAPLRDDLRRMGSENLKRFSWKKTAEETVAVYDELLRRTKTNP
jgi:glycosyltransferase involved in cell wall biosynthesis